MTSVKFNGREVTNPMLRPVVVGLAVSLAMLAIPLVLAGMLLAICLIPITAPLDFILKGLGRRGFFINDHGHVSYNVGPNAFRRA